MTAHIRVPKRSWLLALMILLLLSAHMLVPYFLRHTAVSATLLSGLVVLMVLKHIGLLAVALRPLYTRFRRRSSQEGQKALAREKPNKNVHLDCRTRSFSRTK